jgi:WD40 repeat protein
MSTRHISLPSRSGNGRAAPSALSKSADFSRSSADVRAMSGSQYGDHRPASSSGLSSSALFSASTGPASGGVTAVKIRTAPEPAHAASSSSGGGGGGSGGRGAAGSPTSGSGHRHHGGMPAASAPSQVAPAALASTTFRLHAVAGMGVVSAASAAGPAASSDAPSSFATASRFAVHPTKNLAAYAVGATIVVWDWNVDKHLFFQGHPHTVLKVRFSPDGRHLLSADRGHLFVWDTNATFKLVARVALFDQQKHVQSLLASGAASADSSSATASSLALDFSNDGTLVALALGDNLSIWDWTSGLHQLVASPLTDPEETVRQVLFLH